MIFSGCSAFRPTASIQIEEGFEVNALRREVRNLCLTGDGKGRIESKHGKYLFSYETAHDRDESKLSMGVTIPLKGDEILIVDYSKSLAKENRMTQLDGSFNHRLNSKPQQKEIAQKFLDRLSRHFSLIKMLVEDDERLKCEVRQAWDGTRSTGTCRFIMAKQKKPDQLVTWELYAGQVILTSKEYGKKQRLLRLEAFDKSNLGYERLKFNLATREELTKKQSLMTLDLFVASCK